MMELRPRNANDLRTYRILTITSAFLLLSFTLLLPLSWDNEIYQSMATDLLRFHRLPYLGSWDQNFPGIVFIHAASMLLFGNSAIGFRVFDLFVHLAMSWMLFQILLRWLTPRTAWIATVIYNIRYISSDYWFAGQRDCFAMFFVLLAVVTLFEIERELPQQRRALQVFFAVVAGISMAMTSMIRPTYLPFILIGLWWLVLASTVFKKQNLFGYAAGAALLVALIFLPYVLHNSGLHEFYLATVRFNLEIYGDIHIRPFPEKFYIGFGLLGIFAAWLGQKHKRWSKGVVHAPSRRDIVLVAGIAVTGLVSLVVMGKYLLYHYEPVMLVLIPFIAVGVESLVPIFPSRVYRYGIASALLLFVSFRIAPFSPYRPFFINLFDGKPNAFERAQDETISEPGFRISVENAIIDYIDRTAPAHASIECATLTAGIRWRTERPCLSRFTTFYSLSMTAPDGSHPDFQKNWRKEYIDSLRSTRPYYIVLGNGPPELAGWVPETPLKSIHAIEGFDSLILPYYCMDTTIGGYSILKRRD
jgi:hypothetical protein